MACTLSNKCAKNLSKRTVLLQLIIKNVVTCFFGTQCIFYITVQSKLGSSRAMYASDVCIVKIAIFISRRCDLIR